MKYREFWIVRYLNHMHSVHDNLELARQAFNEARKPRDIMHLTEHAAYSQALAMCEKMAGALKFVIEAYPCVFTEDAIENAMEVTEEYRKFKEGMK